MDDDDDESRYMSGLGEESADDDVSGKGADSDEEDDGLDIFAAKWMSKSLRCMFWEPQLLVPDS